MIRSALYAVRRFGRWTVVLVSLLCLPAWLQAAPRSRELLDFDWRFSLGDAPNARKPDFKDGGWRTVHLPHDWSIEGKMDPAAASEGQGGFFPGGIGWYRRTLEVPPEWGGKRVRVEFEGVYMNAEVYLNGLKLGCQPYGYSTFFVDLTAALKAGANNVLAVRVDNSRQPNSRWYSGSGIYRHVWLHATEPVCVAPWGVFAVTRQADGAGALLDIETRLLNDTPAATTAVVETAVLGPDGAELAVAILEGIAVGRLESKQVRQAVALKSPPLWSPDSPRMSAVRTRVKVEGKLVDEVTTPFGIRHLAWSADQGLMINGKTTKLRGGCIHHDNGVLGACAFDRAEERKIERLKAGGFNAIRTAHNPPSPALLEACDRLGMLVMDEAFDCWVKGKNPHDYSQFFSDWWQRDLSAMVLRDRNHPSVVLWSIGNEIPDAYSAMNAEWGIRLADFVRALDRSRPVCNGIVGWPVDPKNPKPEDADRRRFADAHWDSQDIIGSNYTVRDHIAEHGRYPQRVLVSTESRIAPYGVAAQVLGNSFVVGDFVWAAQDYLGERGVGRWHFEDDPVEKAGRPSKLYPWRGVNCGILDLLGTMKPAAHWRNVVWNQEKLALAVRQPENEKKVVVTPWGWFPAWESWTWPSLEGKTLTVEIHSRYDTVRLYLNDKLVAERRVGPPPNYEVLIEVAYEPGTLRAVGVENGREVEERKLETVGEAVGLRLTPDRAVIRADGQDLSFVDIEVVDGKGRLQPNAGQLVRLTLSGPGTIAGLGNADLKSEEPYTGTQCHVFHGRALVVLRGTRDAGALVLKAEAEGLHPAAVTVGSLR
jgi:beta-galactosidase